jgi:small subunit ribosomal protein S16
MKEVILVAVKIRLTRMGAKKHPFYRIVVADSRSPRDGRSIETLGHYDSNVEPAIIKIDEDKAISWMQNGAQPTDTVKSLFSKIGLMTKWDELKRTKKEA